MNLIVFPSNDHRRAYLFTIKNLKFLLEGGRRRELERPLFEGGATVAPDDVAVYSMNNYEATQRNNGVALRGYDDLTLTMVSA